MHFEFPKHQALRLQGEIQVLSTGDLGSLTPSLPEWKGVGALSWRANITFVREEAQSSAEGKETHELLGRGSEATGKASCLSPLLS